MMEYAHVELAKYFGSDAVNIYLNIYKACIMQALLIVSGCYWECTGLPKSVVGLRGALPQVLGWGGGDTGGPHLPPPNKQQHKAAVGSSFCHGSHFLEQHGMDLKGRPAPSWKGRQLFGGM